MLLPVVAQVPANFEPRGHPSLFPTCDLRSTGLPRATQAGGLAFPSQQPGLLAPDPRYPGFQSKSKFPIEKILPDFHPIPGYLDPRLICLAWPLGEPSPVSVRRFVFILPSFGVSQFTILFNTSITPNRLRYEGPAEPARGRERQSHGYP